ncbi:hypothetical protein WL37_12870 [Burkholderia ubonensis]|nr:hypothetical protein WL37_12870 [Burkholderia ubonensis]
MRMSFGVTCESCRRAQDGLHPAPQGRSEFVDAIRLCSDLIEVEILRKCCRRQIVEMRRLPLPVMDDFDALADGVRRQFKLRCP